MKCLTLGSKRELWDRSDGGGRPGGRRRDPGGSEVSGQDGGADRRHVPEWPDSRGLAELFRRPRRRSEYGRRGRTENNRGFY